MGTILLTQTGGILKPFATVLGEILNGIYVVLDELIFHGNGNIFGQIGIISLCIFLFTFIVKLLMFPMTLKQQKFTKVSSVMNPEIQAIQKKYENKKDQQSQMAMSQEVSAVYEKYGVSPAGSCLQLIIQMPILFALYQVVTNIAAYVGRVKDQYEIIISALKNANLTEKFFGEITQVNKMIDIMSGKDMMSIENFDFKGMVDAIDNIKATEAYENIIAINKFFSFDLSQSPAVLMGTIGFVALLIPILSALFQFLSFHISTKVTSSAQGDNPAMNSMKTMNYIMPLMSAWFCWQFATGLGLYWIAGSVVQILQQFVINAYFKKVTIDDIIRQNQKKAAKKREKRGIYENQIREAANINTKNINSANNQNGSSNDTATTVNTRVSGSDSISARANMVKEFNERNKK